MMLKYGNELESAFRLFLEGSKYMAALQLVKNKQK